MLEVHDILGQEIIMTPIRLKTKTILIVSISEYNIISKY
jgi:hypothetical protein